MSTGNPSGGQPVSIRIMADRSDMVKQALASQVRAALEDIGAQAADYASDMAPVDTGRLASSLTYRMGGKGKGRSVTVGSNAEYAAYVEMGTSRTRTQPYLGPAIKNHVGEYRRIIMKHLEG